MQKLISDRCSLLIVLGSLLLCGCAGSIGERVSQGVVKGVTQTETQEALEALTDSLARSVVQGVVGGVTDTMTQQRLQSLSDSLARSIIQGIVEGMTEPQIRDSLQTLTDELGGVVSQQVLALRDSLLGGRTADALAQLSARLGGVLNQQLFALRDSLLAPSTGEAIAGIADTLITRLARKYQQEIRPQLLANVKEDTEILEQTADSVSGDVQKTIIIAGIVAAILLIIIGILVWRFFRHRKMLKMVTAEIDGISNEDTKKELTDRINRRALQTGLEPSLHKVIEQQRSEQANA